MTALLALSLLGLGSWQIGQAQGLELLQNPSFESYYGTSGGNMVPTGWKLASSTPVSSSGHKWPGESRTGASWDIWATKTVFTAIGYQFVPGVRAGTKLRFQAWANLFTCDRNTSCIEEGRSYRVSDPSSGARVRIGADPTGGTDANAPSVLWSDSISPFDQFQQLTIDFDSQNDNGVTVFLYTTQNYGMLLSHVYWDDASLQLLQPGQPGQPGQPAGGGTPTPQYAPFVKPQGAQPDGSIIHIVQPGDTVWSIAFAYKVTPQQIMDLNHLQPDDFLQIGQKLLIKGPDPALAATGAATAGATGAATQGSTEAAPPFGAVITSTPTVSVPVENTFPAAPVTVEAGVPTEVIAAPTAAAPTAVALQPTESPTIPTVAPINREASVCVTAFDDANANHWRDANEQLLAGVTLALNQGGQTVKTLSTTADNPSCFSGITSGTYVVAATPPDNYGLTTSGQLEIEVKPGVQLALVFGVASGYKPTPSGVEVAALETPPAGAQPDKATGIMDTLIGNSGLVVFALAGLVLVGGLGMALILRRR
jgi:LysM repeat protein